MYQQILWPAVFVSSLALSGCPSAPDPKQADTILDGDGDGFDHTEDCNDRDPLSFPGGQERCDGVDNDCNGEVDDGSPDDAFVWFIDADEDGFGADTITHASCEAPEGFTGNGDDCNDLDPGIHPGSQEVRYDGMDNDCDPSTVDDDIDSDGFSIAEDCNDVDSTVHPAAEESCFDGTDSNCMGDSNLCGLTGDLSLGKLHTFFVGEAVGDRIDTGMSGRGDVDGDGHIDLVLGGYGSDRGDDEGGAVWFIPGPLSGEHSLADATAILLDHHEQDGAGRVVSSEQDLDGDGYADIIACAPGDDTLGINAGAIYIVHGPVYGQVDLDDADATYYAPLAGGEAMALSAGEDVGGDGLPDILIGAHNNGQVPGTPGRAYLISGIHSGGIDLGTESAAIIQGSVVYDYFGESVSIAGDMNSDGLADIWIGSPLSGVNSGSVFLYLGPVSGTQSDLDADAAISGPGPADRLGDYLSRAGDVNRDGYADILITSNGENTDGAELGAAFLVHGPVTGAHDTSIAAARLVGEEVGGLTGRRVEVVGDADGDGFPDLIAGAEAILGGQGGAYLLHGPVSGTVYLSAENALKFEGVSPGDGAGSFVGAPGDLNGDGLDDVLIGAPGAEEGRSAVYVYYGGGA